MIGLAVEFLATMIFTVVSFTQFLGGRVNLVRLLLLIAVQMGGAVSGHFLLRLRR